MNEHKPIDPYWQIHFRFQAN